MARKFGFEAEFRTNGDRLATELARIGMVADSEIHGWHCDCSSCDWDSGYPLRVQYDSTASCEVVSHPFTRLSDFQATAQSLQEAAVEADAEPGIGQGFHVHVDVSALSYPRRHQVVGNFMRWEPVLTTLAGGAWSRMRAEGGNRSTSQLVYRDLPTGLWDDYPELPERDYMYETDYPTMYDVLMRHDLPNVWDVNFYDMHREHDRHNTLNTRTAYETIEFRLWNSTRSAWRMELFCLMSLTLVNAPQDSNDWGLPDHWGDKLMYEYIPELPVAGRTKELVDRQYRYLNHTDPFDPYANPSFTIT